MGLSGDAPDWEAQPLKLAAEQFPFPCSLQTVVMSLYADAQDSEQVMPLQELLQYLKNITQFDLNPVEAVLAQTEAIGDPALPSQEHLAKLEWVNMAFTRWEEYFPLEKTLADEFRKLLPLASALAITDPDFMIPARHKFHALLDTMQEGAIGWQTNSSGTIRGLARDLEEAVNQASLWRPDAIPDLNTIHSHLVAATQKDRGRAKRMAQRVVEAEQGKQKANRAKVRAARMINDLLAQYPAPSDIGEFLKGPWYESAQLLLLKHGAQSDQWANMSRVTHALLNSFQAHDVEIKEGESEESQRQLLFETITRIPKDLKQWLLSLQHDTEGVNRAMSAIEIAHMKVLRQQPLHLETVSPIVIREPLAPQESSEVQGKIDKIEVGQWFLVAAAKKAPVRVQLALKIESDQQLLFTNHMGTKAMQHGYAYFVALLTGGQATPLDAGLSFSKSLAHAAEIRSAGDMTTLSGLIAERKALDDAAREQVEDLEAEKLRQQYNDAVEAQRLTDENAKLPDQAGIDEQNDAEEGVNANPEIIPELPLDYDLAPDIPADDPQVSEHSEPISSPTDSDLARTPAVDEPQVDPLQHEKQLLELREKALAEEALKTQQEHTQANQQETEAEALLDYFNPESTLDMERTDDASLFDLIIPMGTWMGFHDGDKPLMAKLAAHDKRRDTYIFVNREGIKMRDLNKLELVSLLDAELVDMLETRSNFRDEITRIRQKREE